MGYEKFVEECSYELRRKQDELTRMYNLDAYTHWYYDQAAGIFTFSNEAGELNFRYVEVGSYSNTSNTWMWSWNNEDTLKKVKQPMEKIKLLGVEKAYPRLSAGYFDSTDAEGWDFTSIALNLLNGIGAYRPATDHLLVFMVLTEVVDNDKATSEKEKYVDCADHERRRIAFVCQHLKKDSQLGFEESFETYEDMEFEFEEDDFQAWCSACEKERLKTDGWNDQSMQFANIKMVCERCYFEIKAANQ